ncbi:hypothetical protein ABZ608_36625 [Streptomyces sp. NPDC013172]|uniref:hypothetical protein n=1 Tax=unclassified Streptomyces TaxID=2593676 RepID=UPI0033ED1D35
MAKPLCGTGAGMAPDVSTAHRPSWASRAEPNHAAITSGAAAPRPRKIWAHSCTDRIGSLDTGQGA